MAAHGRRIRLQRKGRGHRGAGPSGRRGPTRGAPPGGGARPPARLPGRCDIGDRPGQLDTGAKEHEMSDPIPQQTGRESVSFAGADGARIDAWLYRPDPHVPTGTTIFMAHGIGGIKSAGLAPIAERFAAVGHTCVVFDYRHFGASEGSPRELLRIRAERDDYQAALEFARRLPETVRTVVWGCSFAGLHATWHAGHDQRIAAAIGICPLVDGAHATLSKPVALSAGLME